MNQPPSHLPDDRFVEALLQEHSRIPDGKSDRELIHRILLETVHRPKTSPSVKEKQRDGKFSSATSLAVGSIAAAIAIAVTFTSTPLLQRSGTSRETEELQFVVHVEAGAPQPQSERQVTPPFREALPYGLNLSFASPTLREIQSVFPTQNNFEWVTTFPPTAPPLGPLGTDRIHYENLKITADRSHESEGSIRFSGHVTVEHDRFTLTAEEVTVAKSSSPSNLMAYPLNARNAKLTQHSPYRVAEAGNLKFAPANSTLILTNVAYLETEAGRLHQFSPDDTLTLTEGAFSVETTKIEKYASPLLRRR